MTMPKPVGHKPYVIGGRVSTVNCECGWRSNPHVKLAYAWPEFNHHKKQQLPVGDFEAITGSRRYRTGNPMTNQKYAAEIIAEAFNAAMSSDTRSTWTYQIARALADAGLIAPDLPEPTRMITPAWTEFSDYIDVRDNSVCVYMADNYGADPLRFTPTEARQHAAALLAAANHAEQEQP